MSTWSDRTDEQKVVGLKKRRAMFFSKLSIWFLEFQYRTSFSYSR